MKCICGYEFIEEYDPEEFINKVVKGDESFILIRGTFLKVEVACYHDETISETNVYACPKCRTLRIE